MMPSPNFIDATSPLDGTRGYSPVIEFNGERYVWSSEYASRDQALRVAAQLLESAEKEGYVA